MNATPETPSPQFSTGRLEHAIRGAFADRGFSVGDLHDVALPGTLGEELAAIDVWLALPRDLRLPSAHVLARMAARSAISVDVDDEPKSPVSGVATAPTTPRSNSSADKDASPIVRREHPAIARSRRGRRATDVQN